MAEDLASVRARIRGVRQLETVIGAMRGIAAAHAKQSRALLPGFRAYADMIARANASALRLRNDMASAPADHFEQARIVFCAEQGFVGGFVQRVLDVAFAPPHPGLVLLLGSCGIALARARGEALAWHSAMATRVDGIAPLCIRIAEQLYDVLRARRINSVDVMYPEWTSGAGLRVTRRSLLPLQASWFSAMPIALPPLTTLPAEDLLADLAEEYVFASLCEVAIHSFAAENEARAEAMVRARGKVREMLETLHLSEHRVRQEAITAELLELVGSLSEAAVAARQPSGST